MGLESLVNEDSYDRDDIMPEAPSGSFRHSDMAALHCTGGDSGKPKSQKGIDGKVYEFIAAPSDESASGDDAIGVVKRSGDKVQRKKGTIKKNKKKKKDKKGKKKHRKDKKKSHKKKKSSSSSDSSSD